MRHHISFLLLLQRKERLFFFLLLCSLSIPTLSLVCKCGEERGGKRRQTSEMDKTVAVAREGGEEEERKI